MNSELKTEMNAISKGRVTQLYGGGDNMTVPAESEFARHIANLVMYVRPRRIIETGTYLGTGTSKVIAEAVQQNGVEADFVSVEVNPAYCRRAKKFFAENGLSVHCLNGLSLPRGLLPGKEQIEEETVSGLKDADIFVDHRPDVRARWYYKETDFPDVPDDLLGLCLKQFDFRPDFVLLDSAGHIGGIEFDYLVQRLQGVCWIGLDDIQHIKHHRSYERILSDSRFECVATSQEKFGSCIAKFTPGGKE